MAQDSVRVFISSVFNEFDAERTAARNAITAANASLRDHGAALRFEETMLDVLRHARPESVAGALAAEVQQCQALILILGRRYGTVQENGLAATEEEYDHARAAGLPVLAFLEQFDGAAHAAALASATEREDWAKQDRFRQKAAHYSDGCYAAHYRDGDPTSLHHEIKDALVHFAPNLALHPYLRALIRQWEDTPEATGGYYLPLRAAPPDQFHEAERLSAELEEKRRRYLSEEDERAGAARIAQLSLGLDGEARAWLAEEGAPPLCVLGEFGTGKTRFLWQLAADLARAALARWQRDGGEPAVVPLYAPLGGDAFRKLDASGGSVEDVWDAVAASLARHKVAVSGGAQLRRLLGGRPCALLLDGLAELPRPDERSRGARASHLQVLLETHGGTARTLITGRTHYFPSEDGLRGDLGCRGGGLLASLSGRTAGPRLLYVCPFTPAEIGAYLDARCGAGGAALMRKMGNVFDLLGMARRPVLLNMIVDTVERRPNSIDTISPGVLYECFALRRWDLEKKEKDNLPFAPGEISPALEDLACRIHLGGGKSSLTEADLDAAIERTIPAARAPWLVQAYRDVLRCSSFLKWSGPTGAFEFIHRSYGEFFTARALARAAFRAVNNAAPPALFAAGSAGRDAVAFAADLSACGREGDSDLLREAVDPAALVLALHQWFLAAEDAETRLLALRLRDYLGWRHAGVAAGLDKVFVGERASRAGEKHLLDCGGLLPGFALCRIPVGRFIQGGHEDEDESPLRGVRISRPFWLADAPVTRAQWAALLPDSPQARERSEPQRPVVNVTWHDCIAFCNELSRQAGLLPCYQGTGDDIRWDREADGYRLPTEAEWEYACRAGTTSACYFGNALSSDQANFDGNFPYGAALQGIYWGQTMAVRWFAANAWGLWDMHGNVWEWCWDCWQDYGRNDCTDPVGLKVGLLRIYRGGSFANGGHYCRSASRYDNDSAFRHEVVGFRPARSIP